MKLLFKTAYALSLLLSIASPAEAAGFYIQEQSVSQQGLAFAGAGANVEDASVIFHNPAGMTKLDGAQGLGGASALIPSTAFRDTGSTAGLTAGAQGALGGGNGGNPFSPSPVPNFYAAAPLQDERYWVGIGVSAPFGLSNAYDTEWFGRYDSTKSALQVVDIAPAAAVQILDRLSLGGGVNVQRSDADLQAALPCPDAAFACGAAFSPASDGTSRLMGDAWAVGWNAGALWQAGEKTRVGLHYRSAITHELKGRVIVSGLAGGLAGNNGITRARAKLKLPDIAEISVAHEAAPGLSLLAGANWFGWEKFDNIRVQTPGAADNVTPENYHNSFALAAGVKWEASENLTLKAGAQFDRTPTGRDRTTRTPDADRAWLSLGAGYDVSGAVRLDAAATHIFMADGGVNLDKQIYAGTAADTTVSVRSAYSGRVEILSLQVAGRF